MEQQMTSIPEQSLTFITKSRGVTIFILHSFNNRTYNRIILLFNLPIIFSSLVNYNLCDLQTTSEGLRLYSDQSVGGTAVIMAFTVGVSVRE